jgi:hypothetical protein
MQYWQVAEKSEGHNMTRTTLPLGRTGDHLWEWEWERIKPSNHENKRPSVPTAKSLSSTNQITVPSLRQTRTNVGRAGSPFMPLPDKHWGHPQ